MSDVRIVSWVQHSLQRHKQHGQGLGSIITGARCSPLQPRLGSSQMWSWHTFSLWNRHQGTLTGGPQAWCTGVQQSPLYSEGSGLRTGAPLRSVILVIRQWTPALGRSVTSSAPVTRSDRRTEWTVRPVTLSEDRPAPGTSGEQPMIRMARPVITCEREERLGHDISWAGATARPSQPVSQPSVWVWVNWDTGHMGDTGSPAASMQHCPIMQTRHMQWPCKQIYFRLKIKRSVFESENKGHCHIYSLYWKGHIIAIRNVRLGKMNICDDMMVWGLRVLLHASKSSFVWVTVLCYRYKADRKMRAARPWSDPEFDLPYTCFVTQNVPMFAFLPLLQCPGLEI